MMALPICERLRTYRSRDELLARKPGDRTEAADLIEELYEALKLHVAYEALPADRGGKLGPKGRAWAAFVNARDDALLKARGGQA
jgi:hypothetical protein